MKLTVKDTTSAIALLDNNELFIPAYQRPYRWEGEKSKQLLVDIAEYLKTQERNMFSLINNGRLDSRVEYFTGATVTTIDDNLALEIIDGQQRTTTFYLFAFIRYLVLARILRERIDGDDQLALEVIESVIDARNLVFINDTSFDSLRNLKSKVSIGDLSFSEFKSEAESYISSLTRDSIEDCNWKLKIRYARNRINEDLTKALSRGCSFTVDKTGFKLDITAETVFPFESYQSTLESCLEWLSEEIGPQKSLIAMLVKAATLLSNLLDVACVCNIKAENQKDAYTLFEILNDRSEPLKDLEIAKNLFYRYAFASLNCDDEETDKQLDNAEENWNCAFENSNIEGIVYLAGTMSITNDFTLDFKKGQLADLRKAISLKLGQQKDYSLKNVIKDFDEYRKIGKYINKHYSHQHRTQAVVSEIFNDSRNLDSISLRYFLALKQIKVVALLANILPAISDSTLRKQVALSSLIFSIRSLGSIDLLENLKKIAEALKDDEAIKDQVKLLNGKTAQVDEINKYSNWSYTKSNHVTILKTAFSLYAASNGAKLGYHHIDLTKLANWKDPKEFDLDHIIPKSKYESTVEVSQARINEGAKTNSLGNMMLLGSVTNRNDKSNSIEFLVGEKDKPSEELSKYTHDVSLEDIEANKYIKGIRDIIARHNIETVSDKVSEQLADDVKDFNLKLIKELYTLNIIPLQSI